jgi:acyl-coenzyme A thioesterase PaaI-like protein
MAASHAILPRIPVTLDLETQVIRPTKPGAELTVTSRPVKIGRRIVTSRAEFVDTADDALVAIAYASFIASPNPDHVLEHGFPKTIQSEQRLTMPVEARIERLLVGPGVVDLPRLLDGQNATGAIQGGLVSIAAEEAILSAVEPGTTLASLTMRYFRPFMIGPARATADITGAVATVELVDQGTGKVGAIATARLA